MDARIGMQRERAPETQPRELLPALLVLEHAAPDVGPGAVHEIGSGLEGLRELRVGAVPLPGRNMRARCCEELRAITLCSDTGRDQKPQRHAADSSRHIRTITAGNV